MSEEGRKGRKEGPSERILTPLTDQDGESKGLPGQWPKWGDSR